MAGTLDRYSGFPGISGSTPPLPPNSIVRFGGNKERGFVAAGQDLAIGITGDATAIHGQAITVYEEGSVREMQAGASLGVGALIGASSNGALGPVSGASGVVVNSIGVATSPAASGEHFGLYVRPRQLSDGGEI